MIESDNICRKTWTQNRADSNHPSPAHIANITLKTVHATWFFLVFFRQKMSDALRPCFDLELCIRQPNLVS